MTASFEKQLVFCEHENIKQYSQFYSIYRHAVCRAVGAGLKMERFMLILLFLKAKYNFLSIKFSFVYSKDLIMCHPDLKETENFGVGGLLQIR